MPCFKSTFHPVLRLEEGLCFTKLKDVDDGDLPALSEALEFTIWSPECYPTKPQVPSDILAYSSGELRIYHTTTDAQLQNLFKARESEFKICGFKPRLNRPFEMTGFSFTDDLPGDLLGVHASDLQLAHCAFDDLCEIALTLRETYEVASVLPHMHKMIPRIVRALTEADDNDQRAVFLNQVISLRAPLKEKQLFALFFNSFLKEKSESTEELFVTLLEQRAKTYELYRSMESSFDFLKKARQSLKPLLMSIDLVLYKNFVGPFHDSTNLA